MLEQFTILVRPILIRHQVGYRAIRQHFCMEFLQTSFSQQSWQNHHIWVSKWDQSSKSEERSSDLFDREGIKFFDVDWILVTLQNLLLLWEGSKIVFLTPAPCLLHSVALSYISTNYEKNKILVDAARRCTLQSPNTLTDASVRSPSPKPSQRQSQHGPKSPSLRRFHSFSFDNSADSRFQSWRSIFVWDALCRRQHPSSPWDLHPPKSVASKQPKPLHAIKSIKMILKFHSPPQNQWS